jgi:Trypsin-like peptidase domain/Effector-associated domain 1
MNLTTDELRALFNAIVASYSIPELRRLLLFRIYHDEGKILERVSGADSRDDVVTDILEHSERHGWQHELLIALRESRPQVQLFRDLAARIAPPAVDRGDGPHLQQLVSQQVPMFKPANWRATAEATERRVCLIHITTDDGYIITGTGFLVAADAILTALHVIEPAIDTGNGLRAQPMNVRVWFDRKHLADGKTLSTGIEFGVRQEGWLVASDDDLDYALLRLDTAAGELPLGLKRTEDGAPRRGWVSFPQPPVALQSSMPLVIPQHAEGKPLQVALETQSVIGLEDGGTRIAHKTNTSDGTSGAPCFDLLWNLAAMHVASRTDVVANEAVAITAIAESLQKKGITEAGNACT